MCLFVSSALRSARVARGEPTRRISTVLHEERISHLAGETKLFPTYVRLQIQFLLVNSKIDLNCWLISKYA